MSLAHTTSFKYVGGKLVSSPDLIWRVYRLQYNVRENDTESDPRWGWFWVWDQD